MSRPKSALTSICGVSLPNAVVDAPPLIDMAACGDTNFIEEFQSRMLLKEITSEPGGHNDPRLLRSARSSARLVRRTMKFGLTALTLIVFIVKKKGDCVRPIVDCRKADALFAPPHLWNCYLEMDSRALKSMPLALSTESPLACSTGVPIQECS